MKLINHSKNALLHVVDKNTSYRLEVGKVLEVPDAIAKIWLGYKGVDIHIDQEDLEKAQRAAVIKALNEAQKADSAKADSKKKTSKKASK